MGWAIAIHGGAGARAGELAADRRRAVETSLSQALEAGRALLADGGAALDAVEKAVRLLEDDPLFNAGRGSVLAADGTIEMDASIMDGSHLAAGAVGAVRGVRHPISLARAVMERTSHVLLVGAGAEAFAGEHALELAPSGHLETEARRAEWQRLRAASGGPPRMPSEGTVGAVAWDTRGHLSAGTSTGGIANKRVGRVGDSAVIGAGTWADDRTAAVSGTGIGEAFIRHAAAHGVAARMELLAESVEQAAGHVVHRILRPGEGGLIAVDGRGRIAMPFNSDGMFRAAADADGRFEVLVS